MPGAVCCDSVQSTEMELREAVRRTMRKGGATWVETAGQPSRIYVVVPQGARVKLSGYRATQPKKLAPKDQTDVYRIPLPRKGTVDGDGKQRVSIAGTSEVTIDWKARGVEINNAGHTETWSAQRIDELEKVEGVGGEVWPALAARYAQESNEQYDPMTSVLQDHARTMPGVLGRIVRNPKSRIGREQRVVPVGQATEIGTESFAWLMRQSGRSAEEKAHRGVMCSVRTTEYDTLENRIVRDYAQRTVLEVKRTPNADALLKKWARECHWADRGLREMGVGCPRGHVHANQVLRMNPDYRRAWEARKALLDRTEQTELLWCWQGETWNELALCLVNAAMARYFEDNDPQDGWHAAIRSPVQMRRGQREGRWIETDQTTAGIWVHMAKARVLRLVGGGMQSECSPRVAACRALLRGMDEDDRPIGEMNVYAVPPTDFASRLGTKDGERSDLGCILVVSKARGWPSLKPDFVTVRARDSLDRAMKAVQKGIEGLIS